MTLPVWSVGPYTPLTVANIKAEFDGNIPSELSDYYRTDRPDGLVFIDRVGFPFGIETPIPLEGNSISISNFFGASQVPYTITTDKQIYNEGNLVVFSVTAPERNNAELFWTIEDATIELTVSPPTLMTANRGRPYNETVKAEGGVAPYTFSLTHGLLPPGMTLSTEGRISGITTGSGSYLFNIQATDKEYNTGSRVYSINVRIPEITVDPVQLTPAFRRVPYAQSLSATGGDGSYQFSVSTGNLPPGLTLNAVTGVIVGTPTEVGVSMFKITATDISTNTGSRDYTLVVGLVVITIAPAQLPDASQNFAYSQQLTASGGLSPYTWSVVDTLPLGLTLSNSGLLSGTPTVAGTIPFTVKAVDANGNDGTKLYNLRIISDEWKITLDNFIAAPVTVNEGTALTFRIQSPETLPATLTAYLGVGAPNTAGSSDISQTTDAIAINGRTGTSVVQVLADMSTEGPEYLSVWVEYPRGTKKVTFGQVNITDTSLTPVLTSNITPATAQSGSTVTLDWNTVNPPDGSYVKIEKFNSANTGDATQYATAGTKTFSAPSTGGTDGLGGGSWPAQIRLFAANGTPVLTDTPTYTVSSATYSIVPDKTNMFKGQTVTYTLTTTRVNNGTVLHWVNAGTQPANGFVDGLNSGTVTINNNTATITRAVLADSGVLSSPTIRTILLQLKTGGTTGPTVGTAAVVNVSNLQTFTITPNKSTANEGDTVTWNIVTTSIPNGTLLYWKNAGSTTAADVNENIASGTVTINNQAGSFTLTVKNDLNTEGAETAIIELRTASQTGTLVATASSVSIADTSLTINEIVTGPGTIGANIPGNIVITNGLPNTTFSWTGTSSGNGTLDANGGWTLANEIWTTAGTYTYNIVFNGTGHTRTLTVIVTAAPIVPTFTNGNFETTTPVTTSGTTVQIPGWKIYLETVRLNGFSTIQGFPTPNDPTPSPRSAPTPYGDAPGTPATVMTHNYEFATGSPGGDGAKVLRLFSSGASRPFGIARGPYVVSDSIIGAAVGDTAEFWWKAENGGDDYDIFAYLIDETTGKTIILLDSNGTVTPWAKVSRTFASGEAGTYRFVFISGSYDASGGTVLGASLYIDNIKLIKA